MQRAAILARFAAKSGFLPPAEAENIQRQYLGSADSSKLSFEAWAVTKGFLGSAQARSIVEMMQNSRFLCLACGINIKGSEFKVTGNELSCPECDAREFRVQGSAGAAASEHLKTSQKAPKAPKAPRAPSLDSDALPNEFGDDDASMPDDFGDDDPFPEALPASPMGLANASTSGLHTPPSDGPEITPEDLDRGLPEGTMLEGIRIEKIVGRGGIGIVYRGKQLQLDREVALKVLSTNVLQDDVQRSRFQLEAQTAAKLEHPNIVQVYTFGTKFGRPYIVMQWVDGESVGQMIDSRGQLSLEEVVPLIVQSCHGLHEAHGKGVIHRDVKPDNLIVNRQGYVKIVDFGLSKVASSNLVLSDPNFVLGTPAYIAPEQALGQNIDARTDVYSLGITMYHALVGEIPFDGPAGTVVHKHIQEPLPSLRSRRPELPEELDGLVQRMCAKVPKQRPQDMNEVAAELERIFASITQRRKDSSTAFRPVPQSDSSMALPAEEFGTAEPSGADFGAVPFEQLASQQPEPAGDSTLGDLKPIAEFEISTGSSDSQDEVSTAAAQTTTPESTATRSAEDDQRDLEAAWFSDDDATQPGATPSSTSTDAPPPPPPPPPPKQQHQSGVGLPSGLPSSGSGTASVATRARRKSDDGGTDEFRKLMESPKDPKKAQIKMFVGIGAAALVVLIAVVVIVVMVADSPRDIAQRALIERMESAIPGEVPEVEEEIVRFLEEFPESADDERFQEARARFESGTVHRWHRMRWEDTYSPRIVERFAELSEALENRTEALEPSLNASTRGYSESDARLGLGRIESLISHVEETLVEEAQRIETHEEKGFDVDEARNAYRDLQRALEEAQTQVQAVHDALEQYAKDEARIGDLLDRMREVLEDEDADVERAQAVLQDARILMREVPRLAENERFQERRDALDGLLGESIRREQRLAFIRELEAEESAEEQLRMIEAEAEMDRELLQDETVRDIREQARRRVIELQRKGRAALEKAAAVEGLEQSEKLRDALRALREYAREPLSEHAETVASEIERLQALLAHLEEAEAVRAELLIATRDLVGLPEPVTFKSLETRIAEAEVMLARIDEVGEQYPFLDVDVAWERADLALRNAQARLTIERRIHDWLEVSHTVEGKAEATRLLNMLQQELGEDDLTGFAPRLAPAQSALEREIEWNSFVLPPRYDGLPWQVRDARGPLDGPLTLTEVFNERQAISHAGAVTQYRFHGDGTYLTTVGTDGVIKLWHQHAEGWQEWRSFGPFDEPEALRVAFAFVPPKPEPGEDDEENGEQPVVAEPVPHVVIAEPHLVRLYDAASREQVATFGPHRARIRDIAVSPDSLLLATGSDDHTARIFQLNDPVASPREISVEGGAVTALAFAPAGLEQWENAGEVSRMLVTGNAAAQVRQWRVSTGSPAGSRVSSDQHQGDVAELLISDAGDRMVVRGARGWAVVGTTGAGNFRPLRGHAGDGRVVSVGLAGNTVVSGGTDGTVRLWNLMNGRMDNTFEPQSAGPNDRVAAVTLTPDGREVWAHLSHSGLHRWMASGRALRDDASLGHRQRLVALTFEPSLNGSDTAGRVISFGAGGELNQWSLDSSSAGSSHDGSLLILDALVGGGWAQGERDLEAVFVGTDGFVRLADLRLGREVGDRDFDSTARQPSIARMLPDGRTLLVAEGVSRSARIFLLDVQTGLRTVLEGPHRDGIVSLALSADGRRLASGSRDGTAVVWDVESREQLAVCRMRGEVRTLALNADGTQLLAGTTEESRDGSVSGTLHLFDVAAGEEQTGFTTRYESPVTAVTFLPVAAAAAVATQSGKIEVRRLDPQEDPVQQQLSLAVAGDHISTFATYAANDDDDAVLLAGTARGLILRYTVE